MNELIYRNHCNLFDENACMEWNINNLIDKHDLRWRSGLLIEDDITAFAHDLLQAAQSYINGAPTITTDEYLAYKCPECRVISILYNPETDEYCPNCGCAILKNY